MENMTYDKTEQTTPDSFGMKIPITGDKPKHDQATASIYVDGLSIMCSNDEDKTTEIAFVKDEHSGVEIKIYKKNCNLFKSFDFSNEEKVLIEIKKTNAKNIGKLFKMPDKDDDEDFGWMPDLNGADWHPKARITIREQAKNHLSAKLVLQDATFYTHLKSEFDGLQNRKDGKPPLNLGKIGRVIGADIVCEANDDGVNIKIESNGGTAVNQPLPKDEGPYFISVVIKPESEGSHLHHLYHHIIELSPEQPEYDFKYEQTEKDWRLCDELNSRFTTFVCQTFPSGDGRLPPFP